MRMLCRWRVLAAAVSLAAAVGALLVAGTAHAESVANGSLSIRGDSGDQFTGGGSWSYSTSKGDALSVTNSAGATLGISVLAYNGDKWTVEFDAPGTPDRPVPG